MSEPEHEPPDSTPEPAVEEPVRRFPVRRVALLTLLVVTLIAGVTLTWSLWPVVAEKDAAIVLPATIAGESLDIKPGTTDTVDYLRTAMAAEIDLDRTVGGIYRDGRGADIVFTGGTGLMWTPAKNLESAFALVTDDQGAVTGLFDVPAGPLGGTMRCGTTTSDGGPLTVCGWADHGSLGLAMFFKRSPRESAKVLLALRNAAERRH